MSKLPAVPGPEGLSTTPDVLSMLLADKRSAITRSAYRSDLTDFFGADPTPEIVARFLDQDTAAIAVALNAYKAELLQRGLSEATVNRRLSAIRALMAYARKLGKCSVDPRGLVDGEKVRSYRDTAGISPEAIRKLFDMPDSATIKGKRDTAILRLLWENGLRRAEVCQLDVQDFNPLDSRLHIKGKGRGTQKEPVELSARTVAALSDYLAVTDRAAQSDGALLLSCDRKGDGTHRLTADALYYIVGYYAQKAGLPKRLSPHRIRHSAITAALDATNGNVRAVQRFSRHAKMETVMVYDDNRRNLQGEVTGLLSDLA